MGWYGNMGIGTGLQSVYDNDWELAPSVIVWHRGNSEMFRTMYVTMPL